mgnify:CR=1 FL=1
MPLPPPHDITSIIKADKNNFKKNIKYNIGWLELDGIDNPKDDLRYRAAKKGAAIFARPEGMWYDNNYIYFTCTTGGIKKIGQVWKINLADQTMEMIFESYNSSIMKKCDNITIAPWGDVIICEDGKGKDRLIGLKQDGSTYVIAENFLNNAEFAGVNFAPDGKTLFVITGKSSIPSFKLCLSSLDWILGNCF